MDFIQPVFDRLRFMHGRIGNPGCIQVDVGDENMVDELVARTKAFIAENKDQPFFVCFAALDIHVPRIPRESAKRIQ